MRHQRTYKHHTRQNPLRGRNPLKGLAGGLLAGILFAACQGDNLFVDFTGTGSVQDGEIPAVNITQPSSASAAAIPLGDSVLITVDVSDDAGVAAVVFEGISLRGDPALGTESEVPRFVSKTVDFVPPVADTTISRYLVALPDTILETTQIIVTAFDTVGNFSADTVSLILGGPEVLFTNLVGGEIVQSGATLGLRVQVRDGAGVRQVEITVTGIAGVVPSLILTPISPVQDSLVLDTIVAIPAGVTGTMTITARAWNTLDVIGQAGPFTVTVTSATGVDDIPPGVQLTATSDERLELQDFIDIDVTSVDNNQGSGIARTGYTVLGISPRRGDTLVISDEVTFASPRTGTVQQIFSFQVFNTDPLQLPDTMVYEVYGYAVDASGNCAASVGEPQLVSYICGFQGVNTVALDRTGDRLTRIIVAGRTVQLPTGGRIMDAVMDTIRGKLYLSNIENGRLEVFRLTDETFETAVQVGAEPWGLTLNRGEDTLLVANSGGENIDMVYLGATDGSEVPVDDVTRRLITPPAILFDVEESRDATAAIQYNVTYIPSANPPGFSGLPQYVAVDSTGRILYSTKTTVLGDFGTIRKAFVPAGQTDTEVQLFVQHAAMIEAESFSGIAHADFVVAVLTGGDDDILITDHVPGDRATIVTGQGASAVVAAAAIGGANDVIVRPGRWSVANVGFQDTTYVSASGNGGWVVFGEGSREPVGRVIMYNAGADVVSGAISVANLMINGSETVRGVGLNNDGTLGVALGSVEASFFSTDNANAVLQLQGSVVITPGGSGAALHPLHADSRSLDNPGGLYQPDTHLAFVGSGDQAIEIIDTFFFFRAGKIFTKDLPAGPLSAVLPFPGDNVGRTCASRTVLDQSGANIGEAIEIYQGGNFNTPHPAAGGPTEDACIVVKLVVITDMGGVVVVDVRKSDVLRFHPSRN